MVNPAHGMDANSTPWQAWLTNAHVAPEFKVPSSLNDWIRRRPVLREEIWNLLGDLPPIPAQTSVRILKKEDRGHYLVEKFVFDNRAGANVYGYLVLPKNATNKCPAVLYCHWHGGDYAVGKEEIFQKAHTPEEPALALTQRGYVVMAIDAYCFGERSGMGPGGPQEKGGSEELTASKFNLWVGRSLWSMIVRDDQMALNYLLSRPEVDAQRVAATGISMGCTRTWWLMAMDERLKTGIGVACLTRYQDLIAAQALPAHGIYYFVPDFLRHYDTEAVVSLIAPRPMLFMTGDQDGGSPISGVRKIGGIVSQVYGVYQRPEHFENEIYPGIGHVYAPIMWRHTLAWLEKHL